MRLRLRFVRPVQHGCVSGSALTRSALRVALFGTGGLLVIRAVRLAWCVAYVLFGVLRVVVDSVCVHASVQHGHVCCVLQLVVSL